MKSTTDALVEAQSALELAQDNLRDHGENCFLHDQGEYNACFCGKDTLAEHLQSVVERVDAALALARAEQAEPIYQYQKADGSWIDQTKSSYDYNVQHGAATTRILYATPPAPVPQPVQGEPGSWRLVPVEPTPAMLDVAVSHALMVSLSDDYGWTAYMREIWARMLKAAHGITPKENAG